MAQTGIQNRGGRHVWLHDRMKHVFSPFLIAALVFVAFSAIPVQAVESVNGGKPSAHCVSSVRILVGYCSKYGSTRQYALWLREHIPADIAELDSEKPDISRYDLVIIGSYVRTGRIAASSFIRNHWPLLQNTKIILFTVSGTPPDHPALAEIYARSFPSEMRNTMIHHALPGRLIRKDLSLFDKILLFFGRNFEKDEVIRRTMQADYDHVRRENLEPLILDIRKIMQSGCGVRQTEFPGNPDHTDP